VTVRGPSTCPHCGHDPTGDDEQFVSGGGWEFDNEVADGVFSEMLRCPTCTEIVARETKRMGGAPGVRGP